MEYGLIGEYLSHSFSAEIHPKLHDYKYELKEVSKDAIDSFMTERNFKAINVTIPYKQTVIPYLHYIDPFAEEIGAVNTIVNKEGLLYGYNTDFLGMKELIEVNDIILEGKKVLILGSGGTSKTAAAVAKSLGAKEVFRVSRTGRDGCVTYEYAKEYLKDFEVIINTTPVGMYPDIDGMAIDLNDYPFAEAVIDAVYNPVRTQLVTAALKKGLKASGGLFMLVSQAFYASEYFTGEKLSKDIEMKIFLEMLKLKENIVLIGMPACGKTTAGNYLKETLGMELVDTDELIVKKAGKEITEIFSEIGEDGFRKLETEVIKEVSKLSNVIIATGGGSILKEENVDFLKLNGRLFFLDTPFDVLAATDDRPLSNTREKLKERFNERYGIYLRVCDVHINACDDFKKNAELVRKEFLDAYSCN